MMTMSDLIRIFLNIGVCRPSPGPPRPASLDVTALAASLSGKVFVRGNDFAIFGLIVNGVRLIPSRS